MTLRRLRRSLVLSLVLLVIAATAASAAWLASGVGAGAADADTMPTGNKPTTSVSGSDVTVSWAASLMPSDGELVDGYNVTRYPSGGASGTAATADCNGLVTTTQCVEKNVPDGDWQYTVTPRQGADWIGGESPKSDPVTVPVGPTMHVANLEDTSNRPSGPNWNPRVTVTITTAEGTLLEGAVVSGKFEHGSVVHADQCTTGSGGPNRGRCQLERGNVSNTTVTQVTFTVTDVTHGTFTYDSSSNVETTLTLEP